MNDILHAVAGLPDTAIPHLENMQTTIWMLLQKLDPNICSAATADLYYMYEALYTRYLSLFKVEDALNRFWLYRLTEAAKQLDYEGCVLNLRLEEELDEEELESFDEEDLDIGPLEELAKAVHVPVTSDVFQTAEATLRTAFPEAFLGCYPMCFARIEHPLIATLKPEEVVFCDSYCCYKNDDVLWILQEFPIGADPNYYGDKLCDEDMIESLYCLRPSFLRSVAQYELAQNKNSERKEGKLMKKNTKRFYFDMDGTLTQFHYVDDKTLHTPGYFENLEPMPHVLDLAKNLVLGTFNVSILSAVLGPVQQEEKERWLKREFGDLLSKINVIFVPCGSDKSKYVTVDENAVLIDDHSPNLWQWSESGGKAIKLLNNVNGRNKSKRPWTGKRVSGLSPIAVEDFLSMVATERGATCIEMEPEAETPMASAQ